MLLMLVACGLSDGSFSTGSASIVADPSRNALFAANPEEGTLSRIEGGAVEKVDVGGEPTRIARAKDALYVSLRATRQVIRLDAATRAVTATATVGAEPVGVVAREDGTRVYVAASQSGEVWELDADLGELRRFSVQDQPTWIALHPSGDTLWVASARGGRISYIDLESGSVHDVTLPTLNREADVPFAARMTGDPGIAPDGSEIVVPSLWVDNVTPVETVESGGVVTSGYGSSGMGLSRINPALVQIRLDAHGAPADDEVRVGFVAGFAPELRGATNTVAMRSYLGSARYSPDGQTIWATMDASHTVVALTRDFLIRGGDSGFFDSGGGFSPSQSGFWTTIATFGATDEGPRGVAFLDGVPYVHNAIDRTVASLDTAVAADNLDAQLASDFASDPTMSASKGVVIETSGLSDMAESGRRLFFSATDSSMVGAGSGVSCGTCHLDGRNDGLTWPLGDGPRQTINLAGVDPTSAPFTWTGGVGSVGDEAQLTSSGRMGGVGLTDAQRDAIATFLSGTRPIDHAERGELSEAAARGAVIFAREDVGCATCHSGSTLTDHLPHDLYGLTGVDTPTLVGIAATGPYLHDGTATTLRDVLEGATAAGMGDTSMLSPDELDDLEAYLRTL